MNETGNNADRADNAGGVQLAVAYQRDPNNSTLTILYRGLVIGTVYEDRPGKWLATPEPPPLVPVHPTLYEAVKWLVSEHQAQARKQGAA